MKATSRLAALVGMILLASSAGPLAPDVLKAASIKDFGEVRIDGPFTHKNLAVYVLFLRQEQGEKPDYITLSEGLRSGLVKVTEADNASVGRLLVTNKSDNRLFLQVGQVLSGGKQDRTLQTSFVVPAHTTDAPIPSFCVEQRRWSDGKQFESNGIIVPGSVRSAIQAKSQDKVWGDVSEYKRQARAAMAGRSGEPAGSPKTSSIREELSDARFRKIADDYESALRGVINRHRDPVGLVYAVNGQMNTVDVYQSTGLFKKLFGDLLKSAAADAGAQYDGRNYTAPDLQAAANFIAGGWEGSTQTENLGLGNVYMRITGSTSRTGRLSYLDAVIHAQIVRNASGPIIVPPRPVPLPRPRPPRPEPLPRDPVPQDPGRG